LTFIVNPFRFSASGEWNFDDDFTTNKGWSFSNPSSTNQVDTSAEKLYVDTTTSNTGGTNRAASIDMGLGTVSATNWVFEVLKYRITTQAKYADNHMAITASTSAVPSYQAASPSGWNPSHTLYSSIYHNATTNTQGLGWTTGGSVGDGDKISNTAKLNNNTDYNWLTIRLSATTASQTVSVNADYSSPITDQTNYNIGSTADTMSNIKFGNLVYTGFAEGAQVGNIDQIRFADGVTTPP
tara:strand:- start:649 stop:1368 length:720 start_codon:yes stop_codon:yes gene_type:complete